MSNYNFSPTLDGLSQIDSNNINSDTIICDYLTVDINSSVPTLPLNTNTNQIASTAFVQDAISNASSLYVDLLNNQTVAGIKTFTNLPESSATPTTSTQLTTKAYVDSVSSGSVSLAGANIWTGTNTFNTNLPTSTQTPTTSNQLITKTYADSTFVDLASTQTITGDKTFTNLPISTQTPTTSNQLITKTYADSKFVDLASTQTITGDKTFTGSADFLGMSASYISNTSSIDTPSITSGLGTDDLNIVANQTSGKLFLGCRTNRTGAINIGTLVTGNAPIIVGSTASTTQTATHNAITTFNKIPLCAGVPATGNHLTNKTYVDNAISSVSILGTNNIFTGTNNFKDVVYINNPSATKTLILKSTNQDITMTTGTSNQQSSGASFNCNNIIVPANNTENLITVTIPFNVAGFGGPSIYPIGTVTLSYSSFSVNILKNGASYSGSSPSATLYNYDSLLREWDCPSGTIKSPSFFALLGNIKIPIALDIGNTSTDTYTINLSVTGSAVHSSGGVYTMIFNVLTTGATNFTTTHTANTTSAVFLNTDPTYIAYSKLLGDNGIYLSANNTLNLESSSTIEFLSSTNFNSVLPQSTLTPNYNNDFGTKLYIDNAIAQAIASLTPATNPIGTIIMRASSAVPAGYLYCNGTTYSTVAYPSLWSIIFYTYGGSGPNFKVPDYQSCFIRGFGSKTVSTVTYTAPALGTVQQDQVLTANYATANGYHNLASGGSGKQCPSRAQITTDPIDTSSFLAQFSRQGTENRPINQSVYYYIKY
jgi:hypothetical protein